MKKLNPEITDITRQYIGDLIKQRRISLGMTQTELASCAGIRQHHLSAFEAGNQNLTINKLIAMAGCLRVKIFFEEAVPDTPAGFDPVNEN